MPGKILVVEKPQWMQPTLDVLHKAGYEADGFTSSASGWTALSERPGEYALLIVGSMDEWLDTSHLLMLKSQESTTAAIPAICHASYAREFLVFIESLSTYVQKDFDKQTFDRLLAAVERLLGG